MTGKGRRIATLVLSALGGGLGLATPAQAQITSVFTGATVAGTAIPCPAQLSDGVRVCHGTSGTSAAAPGTDLRYKSFDRVPLEAYVILPPAPAVGSGPDGSYPLIVQSHGYAGMAGGSTDPQFFGPTADAWAKRGYAVLQLTARGFNDSCGSAASRLVDAVDCQNGYVRLDDNRYEIRDVQAAVGQLVDEGVIDPARIGATGESYGGGVSLQLATLKDRIENPDGTFSPWVSPKGTKLQIAAAAPMIPWSDLAYSLVPNGRTLDIFPTSATADQQPVGVEKQSFVSGLFASGAQSGYYRTPVAPGGTPDPDADLTTDFALLNSGEPYDSNAQVKNALQHIALNHSAFYLLNGAAGDTPEAPPPLLVGNGFTDDLFPVDEALRYRNAERVLFPNSPSPFFDFAADFGHMRGQNKAADLAVLSDRISTFFDHYLKGATPTPPGATVLTQTCPASAASGGPFTGDTFESLHPGYVDYGASGAQASQSVSSSAGDAQISKTIDPIGGSGACASVSATDQGAGVATYRLPAATGSGYTLVGAPTILAKLTVTSGAGYAFLAERLWDVDPSGQQTLVDRGVYRIDPSSPDGLQIFELHPGAWHFAAGHVPKLELLGQDTPYLKAASSPFAITVQNLDLRLPVHEQISAGPPLTVPAPTPVVTAPGPKPGATCGQVRPRSTVDRRHSRGTRRGLSISGTAAESPCAQASASVRRLQRVARVYLTISVKAGRRCRFLGSGGRLTPTRSCARPLRLVAAGTGHWTLRIAHPLRPGRYAAVVDAVDARHGHQASSRASTVTLVVR